MLYQAWHLPPNGTRLDAAACRRFILHSRKDEALLASSRARLVPSYQDVLGQHWCQHSYPYHRYCILMDGFLCNDYKPSAIKKINLCCRFLQGGEPCQNQTCQATIKGLKRFHQSRVAAKSPGNRDRISQFWSPPIWLFCFIFPPFNLIDPIALGHTALGSFFLSGSLMCTQHFASCGQKPSSVVTSY